MLGKSGLYDRKNAISLISYVYSNKNPDITQDVQMLVYSKLSFLLARFPTEHISILEGHKSAIVKLTW